MKYLLAFIIPLIAAAACSSSKPKEPFTCIHPAILGGMPFKLPQDASFNTHGQVTFIAPGGTSRITLIGIVCAKQEL